MQTYQITFQHQGREQHLLLQEKTVTLVEQKFRQLALRQYPNFKIINIREYLR